MELLLKNWVWVWKAKLYTSQQHQTGWNKFGDEGCVYLFEGLKNNKSVKKTNLSSISSNNFSKWSLSGCDVTAEGMKAISSFLSQDEIVLEDLNLSLKEKNKHHTLTSNRLEQFWGWRLCSSCWRTEKEQIIEKIEPLLYFVKHFFGHHFSDCLITVEGIKAISSFLSHDGIVLEELDLRSSFMNGFFQLCNFFK